MSKVNRRYIDKHWLVYVTRGCVAGLFGLLLLFNCLQDTGEISLPVGVFLLCMGAIDSVSAIYSSHKRHGWLNALLDAAVDVIAALTLLFVGRDSLVANVVILAIYTLVSGLIDVFHGFISTVDPTDRFIRILIGVMGCVMGVVILNAGGFDVVEFYRFFGVYVLIIGVTSLIYGVHNRAQMVEAKEMLKEMAHERAEVKAELEMARQPWIIRRFKARKNATEAKKAKIETKLPGHEKSEHGKDARKTGDEHKKGTQNKSGHGKKHEHLGSFWHKDEHGASKKTKRKLRNKE